MVFLISFFKLMQDNGRVSMVTQSVMVECILFTSSTKQIEIWLFCFLLISGRGRTPKGLVQIFYLSEILSINRSGNTWLC